MSKDDRKTSKLAIAGLIAAVAIPSLFFLCVLVFESLYKQLNGVLEVILLMLLILPFAALPLSIAGVVVSKKEDMKGLIPGIVGLILSAIEAILVIISIVAYFSIEVKAPDHTLDSIPPHTETETTARVRLSASGTTQLTLDDVIELS
jgi:hypothetical protein